MDITNMIKKRDEEPNVEKNICEITGTMKDGLSVTLERFPMNPYEAIFVLENYLVEKEMKGIRNNSN